MVKRSPTSLSPRDLGRAVGVSESSVKRWADDGRLQVFRTAGGHRRIRLAEAVRFVRTSGLDVLRPDILGLGTTQPVAGRSGGPSARSLVEAIRGGEPGAAHQMVLAAFLQGVSVAALCDGPIRLALEELGELWREGPEGIALEHQAVDVCSQALMEIRGAIPQQERAPVALGGAVERDPYLLPSLMASIVLAEVGFQTLNLGPNVPVEALRTAIDARKPSLVWRSSSIEITPAELRSDLQGLSGSRRKRIDLVVGGRGLRRGPALDGSAVHHFESMTELAGFAKGILRPARGR